MTAHRCPACGCSTSHACIADRCARLHLGALGAEVMRVDPPHRPDMTKGEPADTLLGKRSAIVDASTPAGRRALHELLEHADVVVCGYRPGGLDRFEMANDASISAIRASSSSSSACGDTPVHGLGGADSTASCKRPQGSRQANADGRTPGALPCQLLDHGTGDLGAAGGTRWRPPPSADRRDTCATAVVGSNGGVAHRTRTGRRGAIRFGRR